MIARVIPMGKGAGWKRTARSIAIKRRWDRNNRKHAKASGLCSKCIKRKRRPGRRTCAYCIAERLKAKAARLAAGICPGHAGVPVVPGHSRCAVCLAADAARAQRNRNRVTPFDAEQDRRDEFSELSWMALAYKLAPAMSTADDAPTGAIVHLRPMRSPQGERRRAA